MKHHMTGKVIGVALFKPDPKMMPQFEVAKVKVEFVTSVIDDSSGLQVALSSTGTLVVPLEHVGHRGDFALGRSITADFEDYQQELGLSRASSSTERRSLLERDGEFFDATTGIQVESSELRDPDMKVSIQFGNDAPIESTVGQMRKALDQIKAKRARTTSRHN